MCLIQIWSLHLASSSRTGLLIPRIQKPLNLETSKGSLICPISQSGLLLLWIFRDSLVYFGSYSEIHSAPSLSVSAMSCRMLLEIKQLFNWSVSVGDLSFRKPADFFGGLSRRSWMLHFLKNLNLIHYGCCLKFKLNCPHFPMQLLFSVDKALWFVLSSLKHLLFSALFIHWTLLSVHLPQTESCSFVSPLWNVVVVLPLTFVIGNLIFHPVFPWQAQWFQEFPSAVPIIPLLPKRHPPFTYFCCLSINRYIQTRACHCEALLCQAVWIAEVWLA